MVSKGFFQHLEALADGNFCDMDVMKGRSSSLFFSGHDVSRPHYFSASVTELVGQDDDARGPFQILLD